MKKSRNEKKYVLCLRNGDYVDLDIGKAYESLPDDKALTRGMLRVVDESREDYLYPKDWFVGIALPQTAKRILSSSARRKKPSKLVAA